MSNCAEQDRLSAQWHKEVDKFANSVARLPQRVDDDTFQERYETSRLAGKYAENALAPLELDHGAHQCKQPEPSEPPELCTVSKRFLLRPPSGFGYQPEESLKTDGWDMLHKVLSEPLGLAPRHSWVRRKDETYTWVESAAPQGNIATVRDHTRLLSKPERPVQ